MKSTPCPIDTSADSETEAEMNEKALFFQLTLEHKKRLRTMNLVLAKCIYVYQSME